MAEVNLSDGVELDAPGYVRLNFGCRQALLSEVLRRIRETVTQEK
jgi:bifunctional pyridoxal-dependent enzyme with beta-cystathionase and maltose regulon repressor activities